MFGVAQLRRIRRRLQRRALPTLSRHSFLRLDLKSGTSLGNDLCHAALILQPHAIPKFQQASCEKLLKPDKAARHRGGEAPSREAIGLAMVLDGDVSP